MKFLNEKWVNMNKEIAYRKILRCTNKNRLRNLDRCLNKVVYKWCNETKEVQI